MDKYQEVQVLENEMDMIQQKVYNSKMVVHELKVIAQDRYLVLQQHNKLSYIGDWHLKQKQHTNLDKESIHKFINQNNEVISIWKVKMGEFTQPQKTNFEKVPQMDPSFKGPIVEEFQDSGTKHS